MKRLLMKGIVLAGLVFLPTGLWATGSPFHMSTSFGGKLRVMLVAVDGSRTTIQYFTPEMAKCLGIEIWEDGVKTKDTFRENDTPWNSQ